MGIFSQPLNQNPPQNLKRKDKNSDGGGDNDSGDSDSGDNNGLKWYDVDYDILEKMRNDPNINTDLLLSRYRYDSDYDSDSDNDSNSNDGYNYNRPNFNSYDSGGSDSDGSDSGGDGGD